MKFKRSVTSSDTTNQNGNKRTNTGYPFPNSTFLCRKLTTKSAPEIKKTGDLAQVVIISTIDN